MNEILTIDNIKKKIFIVRGQKIMLDKDLAELYGVTTGNLNKAVKRNINRFPTDFMFQLNHKEYETIRFQFGIFKKGEHSKYLPHAFTEQGIAMLSSVLNSEQAIHVNITIMRIFTKLRHLYLTDKKIQVIESILKKHDMEIRNILDYMAIAEKTKKKIGFK